jgi:zinc-binding alcohol dehydrogenase/oxidoreductase
MRAVVLREFGDADALRLEDVPVPQPGPNEVLVELQAAALNHRDLWIRRGQYAGIALPAILGSDGAGRVVEVGARAQDRLLGQHVVINPCLDWGDDNRVQGPNFRLLGMPDPGTLAEFVIVPVANVYAKPSNLSFVEAAALPVAGLTAYRAVFTRGCLRSGETVLVTGAGGGVATFATQMAANVGARVFVTSASEVKRAKARQLGAEMAFDHSNPYWPDEVRRYLGHGVDVVIDGAGGSAFSMSLKVLQPGGRLVNYGATLGPAKDAEVRRIFWKQLTVLGTTMGTPSEFEGILKLYSDNLRPVIDSEYALADIAQAQLQMESGAQFGKIILTMDS